MPTPVPMPMPTPVPTVRIIVTDERNRVLVLKRRHTAYGDEAWCLPGGKVDYGKTAEETVVAELREETSLECGARRFLFYQDSLPPAPGKMHCINLYFECEATGTVALNRESSAHAWITPADLDRYALVFGNDAALRAYWRAKAAGPPGHGATGR
jgi:8-oxo-dGTP diphosphatase